MNPIVIVMAYAGGQQIFDQHMPLWEAHGLPILVCCPEDSPVKTDHEVFLAGRASHSGPKAVVWSRAYLREFIRREHSGAIMFEYDSFCLEPTTEVRPGLHCTPAENAEGLRFMAPRYPLWPYTLDRASALLMERIVTTYPDITELGFHDRLMGAWAMLAGVPLLQHNPPGFSVNTIMPEHYPAVFDRAQKGCCWWHGIKDLFTLQFIRNAYVKI